MPKCQWGPACPHSPPLFFQTADSVDQRQLQVPPDTLTSTAFHRPPMTFAFAKSHFKGQTCLAFYTVWILLLWSSNFTSGPSPSSESTIIKSSFYNEHFAPWIVVLFLWLNDDWFILLSGAQERPIIYNWLINIWYIRI